MTAEAAASAAVSSRADSAGRSAVSAASPRPDQRTAACSAPAASAWFSPAAGAVGDDLGAESLDLGPHGRVVADHDHVPDSGAGDGRRHRIGRHGQRDGCALGVGQVGQPGFGQGKYFDGDYH